MENEWRNGQLLDGQSGHGCYLLSWLHNLVESRGVRFPYKPVLLAMAQEAGINNPIEMKYIQDYFTRLVTDTKVDEGGLHSQSEKWIELPVNWRLPLYNESLEGDFPKVRKFNRYLKRQKMRLNKHIQKKEYNRAIKIWLILFQRSQSYLLFSLHRCYRNWYIKWDSPQIFNLLKRAERIRRSWDYNAVYNRIYIPKPTGVGWDEATGIRPLGVPVSEWRLILKMVNDICYLVIEPILGDYQYGFRPKRNFVGAWKKILKYIDEGKEIYEFDLQACFNRISVDSIIDWFEKEEIYPPFANYIRDLISTKPLFDLDYMSTPIHLGGSNEDVYPCDKDLELVQFQPRQIMGYLDYLRSDSLNATVAVNKWGFYEWQKVPFETFSRKEPRMIFKFGLPQGWSLSPLLAILAIDRGIREMGLDVVMYADDGLVFHEGEFSPSTITDIGAKYGLELSPGFKKNGQPKCGDVTDSQLLVFLGVEFDMSTRSFNTSQGWIHKDDPRVWEILQRDMQNDPVGYNRKPREWTWPIRPSSWIVRFHGLFTSINFRFFLLWLLQKNVKRIGLLFLPVSKISTFAMEELCENLPRKLKLSRWYRRVSLDRVENEEYYHPEIIPSKQGTLVKENRKLASMKFFWANKILELQRYGRVIPRVDPFDGFNPYKVENIWSYLSDSLLRPQTYWDLMRHYPLDAGTERLSETGPILTDVSSQLKYFIPILINDLSLWWNTQKENLTKEILTKGAFVKFWIISRIHEIPRSILYPFQTGAAQEPKGMYMYFFLGWILSGIVSLSLIRMTYIYTYRLESRSSQLVYASEDPSIFSSWISWALILLILILLGGFIYLWTHPRIVEKIVVDNSTQVELEMDLSIQKEFLERLASDLSRTELENSSLKTEISNLFEKLNGQGVTLDFANQTIDNLRRKLESVQSTLVKFREENLEFHRILEGKEAQIVELQELLQSGSLEANRLSDAFARLADSVHQSGHVSSALAREEYFSNLECPSLEACIQIGRILDPSEMLIIIRRVLSSQAEISSADLGRIADLLSILTEHFATSSILREYINLISETGMSPV